MTIIPVAITAKAVALCHNMKGTSVKLLFTSYSYARRYNRYKLAVEAG
jgi:hypothetical protein